MKKKILLIVPHLSTGGLPQFAVKKIEMLRSTYEIKCVEYSCISHDFIVQRNRIIDLLGEDNLITLGEDKRHLLDIIGSFLPDFVWMEEFPEFFMDQCLASSIYNLDRKYIIIESTHDSSFKKSNKIWFPDRFSFVSLHNALTFHTLGIPYEIIEYPVDKSGKNRKECRSKLCFEEDWKHVVNVGLFTERKNQKYVFDVAKKLEGEKIKFHFIGNQADNFRSYWGPLIESKPSNCVIWGERNDVDDFLCASDLFFFASRGDRNNKELNPIAIKEAIGHDIPIILYNLDVYCGKYDQLGGKNFLTGDLNVDSNKIMEILQPSGKNTDLENLFSLSFESDLNKISIDYSGNLNLDFKVSVRDLTSRSPMYWFNLSLSSPTVYWCIPIPNHIKKFKNNHNFRGFSVEFYDKKDHLCFSKTLIVNDSFFPRIPELNFKPFDCNYINYHEFFIDDCFSDLNFEDLDTVIDIGANVGLFSKYVIGKGAKKVYVVEANPYLKESIECHLGEDLGVCKLFMNPVYSEHTSIDFRFSEMNSTIGSNFFDKSGSEYSGLDNLIKCSTVTIDDIYKDNLYGRISLFKCDIEGGEYPIFESITDEEIRRVDRFLVEFHSNKKGEINIILDKLKRNNYRYEIVVFSDGIKKIADENVQHGVIYAECPALNSYFKSEKAIENSKSITFKQKRLSVIVSSYNFQDYIEECIDSIFSQETNFDFDVIVRDDGSTDDTPNRLKILAEKYTSLLIIDGSKNLGPFENIRKLLDACSYEYVSYIDGDDIMTNPKKLQMQVNFLDKNPDYVMHCTGCKYLYTGGTESTSGESVIGSRLNIIRTEDLLEINHVGFGRTFRNLPNLMQDYFKDLPYIDWPLNFEISQRGLIKYEGFFGGHYRISDNGVFSKLDDAEKIRRNRIIIDVLKERFRLIKGDGHNLITIIDCFVHNNRVLQKLESQIDELKRRGNKILLVSNTSISEKIQSKVDFLLFNRENMLFSDNYSTYENVDLWKNCGSFIIHNWSSGIQKHGLSVLCNLFNSLDLAKSLGFTHFQRIEVDDLYSPEGYLYMDNLPNQMTKKNKKALFYFNSGRDISFHYFFSEIDYFLSKIVRISSENDYKEYLLSNGFGESFINVEKYLYDNLIKKDDELLWKKDGSEMDIDFYGTTWNTETSNSYITSYKDCSTKVYKKNTGDGLILLSFNNGDFPSNRRSLIYYQDGEIVTINHSLPCLNSWQFNFIDREFIKIEIFDIGEDKFIHEISNGNILDTVEFL